MDTNYAALALVIDRSGSMEKIASEVRGSVPHFIEEQKKSNGRAYLTVAQFDHEYEVIHNFRDIKEIDGEKFAKNYHPRGMTALLDAIGHTTLALNERINNMPEADKPKKVVVAVITDGLENSSKEFNIKQIKEMIKEKESLGWDFIFLGATLDTIEVAKRMGFSEKKSAVYATSNFRGGMETINEQFLKARANEKVDISEEERIKLEGSAKKK